MNSPGYPVALIFRQEGSLQLFALLQDSAKNAPLVGELSSFGPASLPALTHGPAAEIRRQSVRSSLRLKTDEQPPPDRHFFLRSTPVRQSPKCHLDRIARPLRNPFLLLVNLPSGDRRNPDWHKPWSEHPGRPRARRPSDTWRWQRGNCRGRAHKYQDSDSRADHRDEWRLRRESAQPLRRYRPGWQDIHP